MNRSRGRATTTETLPPVEVAADQNPDAAVLLELQEADDQPPDLLGGRLEQLVLRERLEERDHRLVVVRSGIRSSAAINCSSLWWSNGVFAAGSMYALLVKRPIRRASPTIVPSGEIMRTPM